MTEQELRKKIYNVMARVWDDTFFPCTRDSIIKRMVDALTAAGIGDVSEWKDKAELAERVIANILCADACYSCNEKYGDCNVQHRDYGSKECIDRLLMLTKEDL